MHVVRVSAPRVEGSRIAVSFDVEPATELYRRRTFTLEFPPDVDLASIPPSLPALLPPLVLHLHWALLAPCRVHLESPLPGSVRARFERLAACGAENLARTWGRSLPDPAVTIEAPAASEAAPSADPLPRAAVAFSGGKDSLLHVGLLTELLSDVVLVSVTAPMPPLEDHVTPRRRHVLETVVERRPVRLVEVRSDARTMWTNEYPRRLGYRLAVNEVTDTLLYTAALWTTAAATGCGHTFLASENEVSETSAAPDGILQHPHAMYAVPALATLDHVARSAGLRYGTLTAPLHSGQVQRLLWTRYPDLRDLQYSCWRTTGDRAACHACGQCLRVALGALAAGGDPAEMGFDLASLLGATRGWRADDCRHPFPRDGSPDDKVKWRLHAQVVRDLQAVDEEAVAARLAPNLPRRVRARALRGFRALRRRHRRARVGPAPGYRREWLRYVDPFLREPVAALYAASFPAEAPTDDAGLARTEALIARLAGRAPASPAANRA